MISKTKAPVLIKHIIRSYARLSENSRVRLILKENIPQIFLDKQFQFSLDETSKRWLSNIFKHLSLTSKAQAPSETEKSVAIDEKINSK